MIVGAAEGGGGGVDGREMSCKESCRAVSAGLAVLVEGDGGIIVSDDTTAGAAIELRLIARYDRYDGAELVVCFEGVRVSSGSAFIGTVPGFVHKSMRS